MRYLFTYDKRSSTDFGVWISGWKTFDAPERDIDTINIPGRSGSLTMACRHIPSAICQLRKMHRTCKFL